jgi:acyl-CoA thioester hydrolase
VLLARLDPRRRHHGASGDPGLSEWRHSFHDRIRYGDLDTNAHLNNVVVHQFFESARVAYMQGLFPAAGAIGREGRFGMIFAETHVRFASPGFYEEDVRVDVRPTELRRSSVKLAFQMVCESDGRLLAEGWGTLVGYDYGQNRAAPLPDEIAEKMRDEGAA